ncbi:ceramidase domain-containing protein [Marinobacterium rhizophilum]|uniref:Ceramidase domain-containing protein n=1 Tax=Marinobacterium rhizophilum TaxID=420402 RepID=A0ABY5HLV1_9GAMM|nr:ceramidase domain-containing protein [Marinobacterium rhizophilum]UTW12787.1 ceramidase domain-containing protein [Marinobacterium rhizophilum]
MRTPSGSLNTRRPRLSGPRKVAALLVLAAAALLLLLTTSPIAQPLEYHNFADQRSLAGLANAANVLSNLVFVLVSLYGFSRLKRNRRQFAPLLMLYRIFFAGLLLIALGSGFYHLAPDNQTLLWDRLPMTISFTVLTALVVAERIDSRLGLALCPWLLGLGLASVLYWHWLDDLRPYLLVQFGPMLLLPVMIWRFEGPGTGWLWLALGFYVLAKVAELGDDLVYRFSQQLISGHTLKHLLAAASAYMIALKVRDTEG